MPTGPLSDKTILSAVKGKTDDLIGLGFADEDIIKLAKKGIDPVKFNEAIKNVDAFNDYPGLNAFLKKQILLDAGDKTRVCTYNVKKASNIDHIPARYQSYVDKYINNLKGAYTEDLLADHIGGSAVVQLSHVNKGGIDYAGLITGPPKTLKIGEAKAVKSLSKSQIKNYITPNKVTGELEFNFNYARGKLGDEHLKDPSIQKEFVLYINSPESETIKQALDLPASVQYSYKDRLGQMITETVTITVKTVSE